MTITTSLVQQQVEVALAEDIGSGDVTASLLATDASATATVLSREAAVVCGCAWFTACFSQLDKHTRVDWLVHEGEQVAANTMLCRVQGNARVLLSAERTALNFLQTLSATATVTRRYVDAVAGTKAIIYDTRKTIPGWRLAQKYAVIIGGGANQRVGLFDAVLLKENHLSLAGGVAAALALARQQVAPAMPIQIEVESLPQLEQAIAVGANLILLDNMSIEQLRQAVQYTAGRALLEASGNIHLGNVRAIAETGVDRISVGALTKHIHAIDLSMRIAVD